MFSDYKSHILENVYYSKFIIFKNNEEKYPKMSSPRDRCYFLRLFSCYLSIAHCIEKPKWWQSLINDGIELGIRAHVLSRFCQVPTLCNPMDCNPPGSSVVGIFSSCFPDKRRLSGPPPEDLPDAGIELISYVSCIGRQVLYHWHHLGSLLN